MDLVTLPQALFVFYGALVLTCGVALGVIAGRRWSRPSSTTTPEPPDLPQQRVTLLELELDQASRELERLLADREYMRELRPPRPRSAAA